MNQMRERFEKWLDEPHVPCSLKKEAMFQAWQAAWTQAQNQWISVEERLPENHTNCLTYCTYCKDVHWNRFGGDTFQTDDSTITHWTNLPEPPSANPKK